ncbi:uncharacterized protein TrAFT101_000415 [Trichoderma asperellum]|uniref:NADH:flavin oxidoreductase/NADH oxidase N-terminal domain-containing protein n=1 Tax=Trichoderma asperellum (strain ATCC 204424 / CBS 433.97 / NBRC 101777) TaxID=1042311 RepID=A0A2T3ZJG0_TRIA4|nr:hypothetical protein M441DRAFT_158274 [Trichoderma asperellum CBS 433.97]PTB44940.1 hypothetical protein M441DRAFT_158274 [Trichoderma asperellum CBS 433.97]UKZ84507.1 hypothetical protein TrAFT101_000415 [Trichoderma asperellum]
MGSQIKAGADSDLFEPLVIAGGKITLQHRIIHAPMTRNRGTPLRATSTAENPNRDWTANDLIAKYYAQRATEGGLLITEAIPPSFEANGLPGAPGLFLEEQVKSWKEVVDAVHAKGAYIYAQLWHAGRVTLPQITGTATVAPSNIPFDDPNECYAYPPPHSTTPVKLSEHPPIELTVDHIKQTIRDYCAAAKAAMEIGFDGIEVHGANGYLPEQFLSSNINRRTDEYGGTPEKRCRFVLELMDELAKTVGEDNLAIRLSPFGLFNQTRGEQRVETWGHLCRELKNRHPRLSYVSFIEPRYEQIFSEAEKVKFLKSWGLPHVDLSLFRKIWGDTPFFSAGGFDDTNSWGVVESGKYDALVYGRYFTSNPDLVERLRNGWPLAKYDRSRFYGPFEDPIIGYTDYPAYEG